MARERYTPGEMVAALNRSKGMVTVAARLLGCSANTVQSYINRYPSVAAARVQEREAFLDVAELALFKAVQGGEAWAVCFALKTVGKARGYVERTEHTGPGGGAIEQRTEHSGVVEVRAVDYRHSIRALAPLPPAGASADDLEDAG
jgi:hypothetical protein